MADALFDGRTIRCLTIVDNYSRKCMAIQVGQGLKGGDVVAVLEYLYDGNLQIDNNLVANAILPIALGRKNYLFAGSHEAAQRSAMIYSLFAICKKHHVNPYQWLKYTLENIISINQKLKRPLPAEL